MKIFRFVFLLALVASLITVPVLAQCEDEEAAVEECGDNVIGEETPEDGGDGEGGDFDLEELCKDEIDALDKCYDDNDISG
eukprot:CAMPEP_0172462684 /NCGR_PEP_ID=MMETSP1065-20121228/44554_1 /TAXON_ID=265537 /ORGANISM="Amphiprora paludosa, Strain CCMP125" /LENGTH=80 /DNA_ID=CAMNT_0013218409 /DNA_START=21 /DNA_END=259 /DNA_ORIENTATION=+